MAPRLTLKILRNIFFAPRKTTVVILSTQIPIKLNSSLHRFPKSFKKFRFWGLENSIREKHRFSRNQNEEQSIRRSRLRSLTRPDYKHLHRKDDYSVFDDYGPGYKK